jgi:uncharacterized protein YhaN
MTATFGKLEHETLTLKPGLNIIEAPNEWGKSTWCAFLVTMLYGLDTRAKTTKAALADKERFAPWSGVPMSGRIELNWDGRDITIERSSKGRTPLGVFRAYETATGLDIQELTAANCGQMLLGVERSVFTRSAFLRFSDLPVTQDDALRHRLNALVTTGDESGAAEALGQKLRDLKNHCRYNKSGLLPQAEAQRDALEDKLNELTRLTEQSQYMKNSQKQLSERIEQLRNHKLALDYAAAQEDAQRVQTAEEAVNAATARRKQLEQLCVNLPSYEEARQAIRRLDELQQDMTALQTLEQQLPRMPQMPETPACFAGIRPEDAVARAAQDRDALAALTEPKKPAAGVLLIIGLLAVLIGLVLTVAKQPVLGIALLVLGIIPAVLSVIMNRNYKLCLKDIQERRRAICSHYGNEDSAGWVIAAHRYAGAWSSYQQTLALLRSQQAALENRRDTLHQQTQALSGRSRTEWQQIITHRDNLADAIRTLEQAQQHLQDLRSMAKTAPMPPQPDTLPYSEAETDRLLSDALYEQHQLQHRLGQCLGQMELLGSADGLSRELEGNQRRIHALEQTNAALEQALSALATARQTLQRRFAPRITQRTQELFRQLTGQRYDRLTLGEDLSIQAGAQDEDVLRSHQWRSDGTVDQLYLALRLAVAQELIPAAPLILDDALVRFDDDRLATALDILSREAENKQVILFTCQTREKNAIQSL